jgi:hypothetical protein
VIAVLNTLADMRLTVRACGDKLKVAHPGGAPNADAMALIEKLRRRKPEAFEALSLRRAQLAYRVRGFRRQLNAWPWHSVPVLALPEASDAPAGHCISCGTPLSGLGRFRCSPCREAAVLVLRAGRCGQVPGQRSTTGSSTVRRIREVAAP